MSKKAITARIYMAGKRPVDIADELEVSRSAVSRVITGRGKSSRIAKHIAQLVGTPASRLWPGKYQDKPKRAA